KMFVDSGVDGMIIRDDDIPVVENLVANNPNVRLANRSDNPFSPVGEQNGIVTGSRQGYGMEIHTSTAAGAGTDSNITFTLHGTLGEATVTVDSDWPHRMENDNIQNDIPHTENIDYVTFYTSDLGHLTSLDIVHDNQGNKPEWIPDDVRIRS